MRNNRRWTCADTGETGTLYSEYLTTNHWYAVSARVRKLYKNKCLDCGERGLHVHHLTYANIGNERDGDLVLLCSDCHKRRHRERELDQLSVILQAEQAKLASKKRRKRRHSGRVGNQVGSNLEPTWNHKKASTKIKAPATPVVKWKRVPRSEV